MIDAYLDESGIHEDAAICVVAGYFAGQGQWRKFEKAWRRVFAEHGILAVEDFHAKDLLKKDDPRHKRLAESLGDVIQSFSDKIHPVTAAIDVQDFESFSLDDRKFMTGATLRNGRLIGTGSPDKPYYIPFQHCLKRVAAYAPRGGKVHFFFGLGHTFSGYASKLYEQAKNDPFSPFREALGEIDFPEAKHTPALQAADLLVHLSYQYGLGMMRDNCWGQIQPQGLLYKILAGTRDHSDHTFQDGPALEKTLIEGLPDLYRRIEEKKLGIQ